MPRPEGMDALDGRATPLGVQDLDQAARILKVDLAQVQAVAPLVERWTATSGIQYISIEQLRRHLERRGKVAVKGRKPVLNLDQAQEAAAMAVDHSLAQTAKAFGVGVNAMRRSWRVWNIPDPSNKKAPDRSGA